MDAMTDCGHGEVIASLQDCWNVSRAEVAERDVEIARLTAELAAFHAECDKVFIPHDAEGLVRHHRGNAGLAGAFEGATEYLGKLRASEALVERYREALQEIAQPSKEAWSAARLRTIATSALLVEHNGEETP